MQTKLQKQQKALADWEKGLEGRLANIYGYGLSYYKTEYVKAQTELVDILTDNFEPDDIFSNQVLSEWARNNGFTKEE